MRSTSLRRTPAYPLQEAAGAKFGDFAGWQMPLEFAGVLAEHQAVRNTVGLFDVSHMGTLVAAGPGAADAINEALTNDLGRIAPGRAQYSMLCNETGGVVDDLIVYLRSPEEVVIVPNAANVPQVAGTIERILESHNVRLADLSAQTGILAVQGPRSAEVLAAVGLPTDLGYLDFSAVDVAGTEILVARTGYTGERGYELIVPADACGSWWERIAAEVVEHGGQLCGLAARDTLRTEMGYPLHGHELSPTISPLDAGLGWAIGWDKPAFPGKRALVTTRTSGDHRRMIGLRLLARGVPRAGMAVRSVGGEEYLGTTTSGTFSPTLQVGIALALVDDQLDLGEQVAIDVRGRLLPAEVVALPFVECSPRG